MGSVLVASTPRPGVRALEINRPEKRNALSNTVIGALADAITVAQDDDELGCLVISGRGGVFSAGADIAEMNARGVAAIDNRVRMDGWHIIENCPKPVIAAVEGYAFGGGNELAMTADFIVAAADARFGQPEINLGILPGDGGTQRLTRAVGKALAMRMMLTGEPIDAATAQRAGLVADIVPAGQALSRALDVAEVIATKNPIGTAMVKQAATAAFEVPLTAGLVAERQAVRVAFARGAHVDAMDAFASKRR